MEPKIFNLSQIKGVLADLDPVQAIEDGFKEDTRKNSVITCGR